MDAVASSTASIAARVPSLASRLAVERTSSIVARGAAAAATQAAMTPAASRPYDDWCAPATSMASAYAPSGSAAFTMPTGAMYIAAPQFTALATGSEERRVGEGGR